MSEYDLPISFPSAEASSDGPAGSAELQGALCGLLCVNPHANRMTWVNNLFPELEIDEQEQLDLSVLFDDTVQQLNSLDFDFQIDVPDDNAPLASRILALADWSQGLVYGLGVSGLKHESDLSADSQEYLADLIQISQVDAESLEQTDAEEGYFAELTEYLRMGLFLLYGELQPVSAEEGIEQH